MFNGQQNNISVTDNEEGVCADPEEREAILGTGGPSPPEKGGRQQLVLDSGGGEAQQHGH
jgi:hypothetical protein